MQIILKMTREISFRGNTVQLENLLVALKPSKLMTAKFIPICHKFVLHTCVHVLRVSVSVCVCTCFWIMTSVCMYMCV